MTRLHTPARRRFLGHTAGWLAPAALAAGSAGCAQASNDRGLQFDTLDVALRELDRLTRAEPLPPATAWNWAQTLVHCAQSIEFSMTGFPEPKSALFQRTAGTAAFSVFAWRGRMAHDLGEPIPGAPALDAGTDLTAATNRLRQAVTAFQNHAPPLRPHFAYGDLSRADYAHAHAMHLANHFSAFQQKA